MNKGDAGYLALNITINGQPIAEGEVADIEITFGCKNDSGFSKSLKKGNIHWNASKQMYQVYLSQEDTMKFTVGNNPWQIRVFNDVSDTVISSRLGNINIGPALSATVLK